MMPLFSKKFPMETQALVDGRAVTVAVRVSERARSYRLSIPHSGGPVLTVPSHGRWGEAEAFLNRQTGWLEARLKRAAPAVSFADGAVIPLRGIDHVLVATGKLRGRVEAQHGPDGRSVLIPGEPAHHSRRLIDWLKTEAHGDLSARCAFHAQRLGVRYTTISMRSQATRWGSCSSRGSLNFNWRLVMAPPFVLDYVAAHEVAHLVEMNHSQAFWDTVARTLPDMDRGRAWLKAHGRTLMAYGND